MMPILSQSTIHLAQEPSVFVIKSLQDVVNSYTDFRSVYSSLQISINVAPLVSLRQKVVEIEHWYGVVLCSEHFVVIVVATNRINLTVRNQKFWNGFLSCRWQCLIATTTTNDLGELCLGQWSVGKWLHQMDFFCRVEAVEQFKHISVKLTDIGYFHIELDTLTCKNLVWANDYSPANKNWKLLQAFGCTIKIEVWIVPHSTDAQFKSLPSYRFDNGWNGKGECKSLVKLCLFTLQQFRCFLPKLWGVLPRTMCETLISGAFTLSPA